MCPRLAVIGEGPLGILNDQDSLLATRREETHNTQSSKLHGGVDEHSEASTRRGTRATSAEVVRSYRAGGRPTCDQERYGKNQLGLPGVYDVPAGGENQ